MFGIRKSTAAAIAAVTAIGFAGITAVHADQSATTAAIYKEVEQAFGFVPSFIKQMPESILPGFWQIEKDLELNDHTALTPKVKALISLAVAAQIPCAYCIYLDTNAAREQGATDQEIGEAVAMAALTRQASTLLNGLQVDLEVVKREFPAPVARK